MSCFNIRDLRSALHNLFTRKTNCALTSLSVNENNVQSYVNDYNVDLGEDEWRLILSKLPIIDKFRCETICKNWQKWIFDGQTKLSSGRYPTILHCRNGCKWDCGNSRHNVGNPNFNTNDCMPQLIYHPSSWV